MRSRHPDESGGDRSCHPRRVRPRCGCLRRSSSWRSSLRRSSSPSESQARTNRPRPKTSATTSITPPHKPNARRAARRSRARTASARRAVDKANAVDRKFAGGNPRDAKMLAKIEAKAMKAQDEPAPDQAGQEHAGGAAPDDPRRVQRHGERRLHRAAWCRGRCSRAASASPATSRTARSTTTSRTRRPTATRTTTRSGCRTSRRSTSTRCSTPRRASPSGSAPT